MPDLPPFPAPHARTKAGGYAHAAILTRHDALPDAQGAAFDHAILLVDKPEGLTSFDVVAAVRRATGIRKVGHAGTLDPMATGLLVILVARGATKQMEAFMELPKVYTATVRLGETTASYDRETPVETTRDASGVATDAIEAAIAERFTGAITQRPPMYSAVKVGGERLYKKARRGETAPRPPRHVTVYRFEVTGRDGADVHVRIACSKGTYIRSLGHDLGEALGVGGHLVALRRTAIGPYRAADAWPLGALTTAFEAATSSKA